MCKIKNIFKKILGVFAPQPINLFDHDINILDISSRKEMNEALIRLDELGYRWRENNKRGPTLTRSDYLWLYYQHETILIIYSIDKTVEYDSIYKQPFGVKNKSNYISGICVDQLIHEE